MTRRGHAPICRQFPCIGGSMGKTFLCGAALSTAMLAAFPGRAVATTYEVGPGKTYANVGDVPLGVADRRRHGAHLPPRDALQGEVRPGRGRNPERAGHGARRPRPERGAPDPRRQRRHHARPAQLSEPRARRDQDRRPPWCPSPTARRSCRSGSSSRTSRSAARTTPTPSPDRAAPPRPTPLPPRPSTSSSARTSPSATAT